MAAHVTRLEGPFDERRVIETFTREGLSPHTWSNAAGDVYGAHSHSYHKVLYCLRGSIVFGVDGEPVTLGPGDRLDIEPGTVHSAEVGREGVTCIEAPLRGST
jgi:quercetin dioxygenase-like cupin family protein